MTRARAAAERRSRIVFVVSRGHVPQGSEGTICVVTDTAWSPSPMEREDVLPLRPVITRIVERMDLFEGALERLDRWAAAAGVIDRMTADGVSLWHGIREPLWHWLHERMLWAFIVEAMERDHDAAEFRCSPEQAALLDVLMARGETPGSWAPERGWPDALVSSPTAAPPTARRRDFSPSRLRRMAGRVRRRLHLPGLSSAVPALSKAEALDVRVRAAAAHGGRGVLVLSYTGVSQTLGTDTTGRVADPHLDSVVARLGSVGLVPIILSLGLDRRDPAAQAAVALDERLLPGWLLSTRWARRGPKGPEAEQAAVQAIDDQMATATNPSLVVAGVDLGPQLWTEARRLAMASALVHERLRHRVDALITELQPAAILMTHEGLRMTWLVEAAKRPVPTFAVQHGVIYPTHPGYRHQRQPGLPLPTCTFVYGPHERRTLLEFGGYEPAEVVVSGSPRLDLDQATRGDRGTGGESDSTDRLSVRSELGVAEGDRLLVVSTLFQEFIRWSHLLPMLGRLLAGPLPRVHVVFKLHPGESDEGPYRALMEGLAAAGEFEPPPISVVRDIDLYRLLRAADAHLGMHSTVLTDAVVAGTPNLIATVDGHTDILGYIPAQVARPIGSVEQLLAALDDPWPPDPEARQRFLDDHFRAGDASARIVETVRQASEAR